MLIALDPRRVRDFVGPGGTLKISKMNPVSRRRSAATLLRASLVVEPGDCSAKLSGSVSFAVTGR